MQLCNLKGGHGTCERWINQTNDAGDVESVKVRDVGSGMITYGHTTVGISGGLGSGLNLVNNFIHELGHVFNNTVGGTASDAMVTWNEDPANAAFARKNTNTNYGFYGAGYPWQQARVNVGSGSEDFADSFLGWAYNLWDQSYDG